MIEDPAGAHRARLARYVEPHLARRSRDERHPVHDFLFTYYSFRPAELLRWHEGDVPPSVGHIPLIESIHRLLVATASRPPTLGCFGLHEWAMVHRAGSDSAGSEGELRHDWPLRLGGDGTDEVVDSHRIGCSHVDAFRFFTPSARPLNTLRPGRDDRADFEQPGCLHAGMDLYKHAFRLSPLISSSLVADCFELAWDIRIFDMRAAPYDLTGLVLDRTGVEWTPIKIETPEGKQEYATMQRRFAEWGAPLRRGLIDECVRLLGLI